ARRGEPARRRAALPDDPARAERAAGDRAGAARRDASRRGFRGAGLSRMDLARAGDRRAHAGLPARRAAAPLARPAPFGPHRSRDRRVLEAAAKKSGMDAAMTRRKETP